MPSVSTSTSTASGDIAPPMYSTKIAAIVGPTASGKTALAVALRARGLPVEVVCCDALQLVQRLDAATAKPTAAERAAVPHHLVDVLPPTDPADAGRYAALADEVIADITSRGAWPLLVGGTGLYLRAVVRGLAALPASSPPVRAALEKDAATLGLDVMHARLQAVDPDYAAITPAANRQRVLRALEVVELSGRPFSAFHSAHAAQPDRYACATVVLQPGRERHLARLEARAHTMAPALLREVRTLLAEGLPPSAPGMQALGYRQAAALVQASLANVGETASGDEASASPPDDILLNPTDVASLTNTLIIGHRRYAKRQRTWFRKTTAVLRLDDPGDVTRVADCLTQWWRPGDG